GKATTNSLPQPVQPAWTIKEVAMKVQAILFGLTLAVAAGEQAVAQADYPNKPVTFIVPFAPGGTTDILARLVSQRLEQRLGKPFIVENRPGGGGLTGAVAVTRAPPDGYTLIMASSTMM